MSNENTTIASGSASSVVVEGLAEMTKADKMAKIKALQAAKAGKARAERKAEERMAKLVALRDGIVDAKLNPKGNHNPQVRPETLRPSEEGEQINGRDAKGWVVSIECEHCGDYREINTQDAFQVRFCEEHKAEAAKAAGKARREAKKDAELLKLSDEELDAQIAELEQAAA